MADDMIVFPVDEAEYLQQSKVFTFNKLKKLFNNFMTIYYYIQKM